MSPDPFFQPGVLWNQSASEHCHSNCRERGPGGFCSACIHPACLRIADDGTVRVGLSAAPEDWFTMLPALGNVLHLTRNAVAVLGQIAPVPTLFDRRNPVLPRDAAGTFTPNLAEHASLWAVREPSPLGPAYGFETRDVSGHAFQRIVLTAPANRELFERFVTDHQSPPNEAAHWFPPNHAASAQRQRALARRIPFLRAQFARPAPSVRALPPRAAAHLFAAAAKQSLPLRTTHYTPALVRAATWTPQTREISSPTNDVEFIHGEASGLHLFPSAIASVWLWQGRCDCCDKQHWTVEIGDALDRIALAITVGDSRLESDWRELLTAVAE
jgi:hypothetical protein